MNIYKEYIKEQMDDFEDFRAALRDGGYVYSEEVAATLYTIMMRI